MDVAALLEDAFRRSLDAVEPRRVVAEAVRELDLPPSGDVVVLGLGKAAPGMAWGVHDVVGPRLTGMIVAAADAAVPHGVGLVVGDHPVPGRASLEGGAALMEAAAGASVDGTVIALVSGGGSALAEVLVPAVDLGDLRQATEILLRSGAPIEALNAVRTSLSQLKGGGLAGAVRGKLHALLISDVVGDRLDVIASGPTVETEYRPEDGLGVLREFDPARQIPEAVRVALGNAPAVPRRSADTLRLVATGADAAGAAAVALRNAGLDAEIVDLAMEGEAREVARQAVGRHRPDRVEIYAGETTVTVAGSGRGGRNHEAALAAAIAIDGTNLVFLAAGTDGIDGMTDGAGAAVDGATAEAARTLGIDPVDFLSRNDAGGFFDLVPGRITTAPTGTNVGDVWFVASR